MHWETSYVLLLWMSIIVKIPFHMSRLDSFQQNDKHKTVIERVLNVCKSYIQASSYFMIPAGFLTSHYVTRSDIKDYYLKDFLQWLYKVSIFIKKKKPTFCLLLPKYLRNIFFYIRKYSTRRIQMQLIKEIVLIH